MPRPLPATSGALKLGNQQKNVYGPVKRTMTLSLVSILIRFARSLNTQVGWPPPCVYPYPSVGNHRLFLPTPLQSGPVSVPGSAAFAQPYGDGVIPYLLSRQSC